MADNLLFNNGIVVTNNSGGSIRDIGVVSQKNIRQCMNDVFYGVLGTVTENTAVISQVVGVNWVIEINTGLGQGQRRAISNQTGFMITVPNWSVRPHPGDEYTLYNDTNVVFLYRQLDGKFYMGTSPTQNTDNVFDVTPATLVVEAVETRAEIIYYVGKHGSDSNTGNTMSTAKLTFGAVPPGQTIVCLDSGVYAETVSAHRIYAPQATIMILNLENSYAHVGTIGTVNCTAPSNLKFDQCNLINTSAILHIHGERCDGINATNIVRGFIGTLTGTVNTSSQVILSVNVCSASPLQTGLGTLEIHGGEIGDVSGNVMWHDVNRVHGHITNTSNPHQVNLSQISPLNTKGDLLTFSTQHVKLPVGLDGQILQSDSSSPSGLSWFTHNDGGDGITEMYFSLLSCIRVENPKYIKVYDFAWINGYYNPFNLVNLAFFSTGGFKVRITGAITYLDQTVAGAGYQTVTFIKPVINDHLLIEVAKLSANIDIVGLSIRFAV